VNGTIRVRGPDAALVKISEGKRMIDDECFKLQKNIEQKYGIDSFQNMKAVLALSLGAKQRLKEILENGV
jgi:hypothetical protein